MEPHWLLILMKTLMDLYPDHELFAKKARVESFNLVMGDTAIYDGLISGKTIEQMEGEWYDELDKFLKIRGKYLLY